MVRRTLAVGVLIGTMVGVPAASAAKLARPADVVGSATRFTRPPSAVRLPRLPAHPTKALIRAVNADSRTPGRPARPGRAIRRAHIPRRFAGRLAILLRAANGCRTATTDAQQLRCARLTSD